jgi:hypothetical protein
MENKDTETTATTEVKEVAEDKSLEAYSDELNKIYSSRSKRDFAKVEKELATIRAEIADRAGSSDPKDEGKDTELAKQLKAAKAHIEKIDAERKTERADLMVKEEKNTVFSALNTLGAINTKMAFNHLKAEGMISRDEDGQLIFNGEYPMSLDVGLKKWLDSDEGKVFLPARNIQGSGAKTTMSRSAVTGGSGNNKMTKDEARTALGNIWNVTKK